jgi:peptidyl-prolyl cis-trans isomerase D
MLDVMRRHAQSWVIKGIFVIIIIVFILFWTEPGEKGAPLQVVAVVDGSKITLSEYRRSYDNLMNVYRSIFREGLSEETIKMMKLSEKALDSLIEGRLLLAEAERLGLTVSDAELIDSITRYPAFQKEDAFDKARYLAVLKANRLAPDEFEEGQRRNLLVGKVEGLIKAGGKVSDGEVWEEYVRQREKVNLELIKIEPKGFLRDAKASDDEAREYFSKNRDSFKLPASVKTEFMTMDLQDVERTITIKEDELRSYYEKNIDLFMKPKREEGAIPFEEAMGQVAVMFRREKAEEVMRERIYKAREDAAKAKGLEDVAAKEKLPMTRTGFFSAGEEVEGIGANPDFYREAFTLKAGDVSQPVKTPSGYLILKVIERKEARVPEYEEAKDKVYSTLAGKKAEEMALKKGEEILKGLIEGKLNFSRLPYKPSETGFFGRGENVPNAGASEEMNKAAFLLTKETPYPERPFTINGITYVIKLKERIEADRDGLKAEESSIRERLMQQKGEEALKSWLKVARGKAKVKIYEDILQ